MTYEFTFFSTAFQAYQNDEKVIIKGNGILFMFMVEI